MAESSPPETANYRFFFDRLHKAAAAGLPHPRDELNIVSARLSQHHRPDGRQRAESEEELLLGGGDGMLCCRSNA